MSINSSVWLRLGSASLSAFALRESRVLAWTVLLSEREKRRDHAPPSR